MLTAAVLRLLVRLVATVVATVAETVAGDAAVVAGTPAETSLARVLLAELPCIAETTDVNKLGGKILQKTLKRQERDKKRNNGDRSADVKKTWRRNF